MRLHDFVRSCVCYSTAQQFISRFSSYPCLNDEALVRVLNNGPIWPNASNVKFTEITTEQEHADVGDTHPLARNVLGEGLDNFFTRPLHLYDLDWTTSTTSFTARPWYEWFRNKRIANRIINHAGFKGKLHLKFVVIGNPFFFGRMQVSYQPIPDLGGAMQDIDYGTDNFGFSVIRSQRQKFDIDPSVSTGAEMILPFVWELDFMNIDSSTEGTLYQFGTVDFDVISSLQDVGSTTGGSPPAVTIRVYAWMDDFELLGLSAFNPTINPQCDDGQKVDWEQENVNKGVISKTLTSVSNVADKLSEIPAIEPFATPTKVVSGLAAELAQKLGYSNPLEIKPTTRMQPRPYSGDTHVIGGDTAVKLTLDPYQTTTVDPVVLGGEGDEMSFKHICSINSLFNSFAWVESDPAEHLIATYPVTPLIAYTNGSERYATAMGGVANLFNFWNGSIHFTFDVISTCFHRGRILVVYDPMGSKASGSVEEVVQYVAVVDLSETRSFTVSIGFNSPYGMLQTGGMGQDNSGSATPGTLELWHNGYISLYVANKLTIPNYIVGESPTGVDILSYVKGGDDLSFAFPREIRNVSGDNNIVFVPNSNMSALGDPQLMRCCDTETITTLDVGYKDTTNYPVVYKGEDIQSLRTLLKRYVHYYSALSTGTTTRQMYKFAHGMYPILPGEPIGAEPILGGDPTYNYCGFTALTYSRMAFATIKGGCRWKFVPMVTSDPSDAIKTNHGVLMVTRTCKTSGTDLYAVSLTSFADSAVGSKTIANHFSGYMSGGALTINDINGTLEFEMPFQTVRKFHLGRTNDAASVALSSDQQVFNIVAPSTSIPRWFSLFVATGEDFNLQHFIGWPPYRTTTF